MSHYIQLINRIKRSLSQLILTKNQVNCRVVILSRLAYPGVINLFGRHGVGKTTLGWWLTNEACAVYLVEPKQIASLYQPSKIAFVDNADHHRSDFRRILGDLEKYRINRAVIVTLHRIEDSVQALELDCDPDDLHIASTNLVRLGYPAASEQITSLWDLVHDASLR